MLQRILGLLLCVGLLGSCSDVFNDVIKKGVTTHTVSFDSNGGSGSLAAMTMAEGSTVTLSANTLSRSGYAFTGWATTATGAVVYNDGTSFTMGTSDVVLYAVWSSSSKAFTAFGFSSPSVTGTISGTNIEVAVPYGTAITALVATFTTTGASVSVGSATQISGTTANNFSSPVSYVVTAAGGTTQTYTVTVTIGALTVNFDANGGSGTMAAQSITTSALGKATLNTHSFTRTSYNFAGWTTSTTSAGTSYANGAVLNSAPSTSPLSLYAVWLPTGITFTSSGNSIILTGCSTSYSGALVIPNGVTAIAASAFANCTALTSVTIPASVTSIGASAFSGCTALTAVFLNATTPPNLGSSAFAGTNPLIQLSVPSASLAAYQAASTWSSYTGSLVSAASAKAITAFSFASPAAAGTISGTNIALTVPFGTAVTALVASFTTTGASVSVGSTPQTSGTTANNFTNPVSYLVTAADGSTQTYTVTVTVSVLGTSGISVTTPSTITIALSGNSSSLTSGSTMTVTATPSVSVDSYAWYLDGALLGGQTAASVTIGSGLAIGPHSLTVLVKKNGVSFSTRWSFTVTSL